MGGCRENHKNKWLYNLYSKLDVFMFPIDAETPETISKKTGLVNDSLLRDFENCDLFKTTKILYYSKKKRG